MIDVDPFFILANPRSGSSLLRIICECNDHVTVPPECGFLEWWHSKYKEWSEIDSANQEMRLEFYSDLGSSKKFNTWNFNFKLFEHFVVQFQPRNYVQLISLVYFSYAKQRSKDPKIWGDKNNYYIHKTELLHKLFPEAKYIHMLRDGRDVATSYKELKKLNSKSSFAPKLPFQIERIAHEWNDNNQKLNSFFKSLHADKTLTIRFEDLIFNLEYECLRISEFLEVPYDPKMLQYYKINRILQLEPKETLDWKKKTLKKPDISGVGKYKKVLSQSELLIFQDIAAKSLKLYGYD